MSNETGSSIRSTSLATWLVAALVALGLAAFDPFGWDSFGPIRWLLVPALGFAAAALSIEERTAGQAAGQVAGLGFPLGRGDHRSPRSLLLGLWAALLGWGLLATGLAADPLHAWIGTPDRRFGWFTWLLCGALFISVVDLADGPRSVVGRGFVVGGLGLGGYTVLEWGGLEWAGLAVDPGFAGNRLGGPFGQPAYLGAAAALATPVVAGYAADRAQPARWRLAAATAATAGGFALLASQSRAAWLGVATAGAVCVLARLKRRPITAGPDRSADGGRRAMLISGASAATVAALVLAIPTLRLRLTSSFGDGGVVQGRIDEWQVGWRALIASPIVGHGPEGYRTVFGSHVDAEYVIDWGRDVITDRAHSGFLDVGLSFGLPGALLHLGILGVLAWVAVRSMATGSGRQIGLGVGVLAYIVQQQFLFPLSEVDPLFWVAAGLLVADRTGESGPATSPSEADHKRSDRSIGRSLARGLMTGLAIVVTLAGLLDVAANLALDRAIDQPQGQAALDGIETSIALRPDSIRYRFIASRLADQSGQLDLALRRIEQGLDRSSSDPALRGEQARLLLDRARAIGSEPQRTEAVAIATAALDAVVADDPYNPALLQRLGIALAIGGQFDRSIEVLQLAMSLAPGDAEPRQNLAEVERLQREFEAGQPTPVDDN